MVTNLTEEAKAIWAKAIAARDPNEKLRLLQLFYSKMPHHKGTEKLEVSIKRQMAALKEEIEESKKKKAVRKDIWIVKKEGLMAVVVDYDVTDSFKRLTGVEPPKYEIFEKPFVAPLKALDLTIQVYYAPLGAGNFKNFLKLVKQADVLIIADQRALSLIGEEGLVLVKNKERLVEIQKMPTGGIRIIGKSSYISEEELRGFLRSYGLFNCIIKISEKTTLDDVEDYIFGRMQKVYITPTYVKEEDVKNILAALGLIRVYTLDSEGNIEGEPMLLPKGSSVLDLAEKIGISKMKSAFLVRGNTKIKVGPKFTLEDGDKVRIIY
mgnify:FL=1